MDALWTKADGTVIPIRLMSDKHLENTILMMRRRGYVSTSEHGPQPIPEAPERVQIAWAAVIASPMLEMLAWERYMRMRDNRPPLDDDEAEAEQARWAASIRVGVPRPARAPGWVKGSYPPRHSLSLYRGGDANHGTWPDDDPYGSQG